MILEPAAPPDVLRAVRAPFAALGAALADVPILQPLGPLLDLSGELMRARLFVVQGAGDEELCLRPDFTIPIARAHLAAGGGAGRYIYEGKAFRTAPRGSGRAEEFLQCGFEYFGGVGAPEEDADSAALAWRAAAAGGRRDLTLVMGDVGTFAAFVDGLGLADPLAARLKRAFAHPRALAQELDAGAPASRGRGGGRLAAVLAGLPESEASAALEELWALAGIRPVGGRQPAEIVRRLAERADAARAGRLTPAAADLVRRFLAVEAAPPAALEHIAALAREGGFSVDAALELWSARLRRLDSGGAPAASMRIAAGLMRAFGYYDGFLFEVRSGALGPDAAVAAGGRYDGLPRALGGGDAARAVGCMVRPARAWAGLAATTG